MLSLSRLIPNYKPWYTSKSIKHRMQIVKEAVFRVKSFRLYNPQELSHINP